MNNEITIKLQTQLLRELLRWRYYADKVAKAAREVLGDVEVYVGGSAVEGNLTASSDIDIFVVLSEVPKSGLERARLIDVVWARAEEYGVPWWYPIEIHLITKEELKTQAPTRLVKLT